jgi:uracil phosphoribosyltransferase
VGIAEASLWRAVRSTLIVDHPLAVHRLSGLRDATTDSPTFRQLVAELSTFVAYEALRDLATVDRRIDTPVASGVWCPRVEEMVLLVPVLRAGLGMVPAIQADPARPPRWPTWACVATRSRCRPRSTSTGCPGPVGAPGGDLRPHAGHRWILGPGVRHGEGAPGASNLTSCASSPRSRDWPSSAPGMPTCDVACVAVDPELDDRGFIVPGLGDAGDRLFGPPD